jgi:hypothetical protein
MSKIAMVSVAMLCLASAAEAEDIEVATEPQHIKIELLGAGAAASCGKWLAMRKRVDQDYFYIAQWSLGYLAGVASIGSQTKAKITPLNGFDADAVFYWIDKYCGENPTKQLSTALANFSGEHPHGRE